MIRTRNRGVSTCISLCIIHVFLETVPAVKLPVVPDKSTLTVSLKDYNVTDPNGQSVDSDYVIKPNTSCHILVTSIPTDAHFVLLQAHAYLRNITLSYYSQPTLDTSVTGTNIGLTKLRKTSQLGFYLSYNTTSHDNATVLITVQAYSIHAPVPGGCNMEFNVETSPYLRISFDESLTQVDFAPAAPPLSMSYDLDEGCNVKPSPITYRMYRMYMPERNFSELLYFKSVKSMMTLGQIVQNGRLISDKYGIAQMRHLFAAYPGTGSVFAVVAETETGASVYVPSITYSCNIKSDINNCRLLSTTFSKFVCAAMFFTGLFASFAAHRYFKVELLLLGFVSGSVLAYIIALNLNSPAPLEVSLLAGSVSGAGLVLIWLIRGVPIVSFVVSTLLLGYLTAAFIFIKLVDVFDALESDVNYWSLFSSISLLAPILMITLSGWANVIACSILGAYASVLAVDYYIGSNLRFAFLNTVRRATVDRFRYAVLDPPFQEKDAVLLVVWIVLSATGVTTHTLLMRNKPPYPAPSDCLRVAWNRCRLAVQFGRQRTGPTERTPLLRA